MSFRKSQVGKIGYFNQDFISSIWFLLLGVAAFTAFVTAKKKILELNKLQQQFPSQPWKWRSDWCENISLPNEIRLLTYRLKFAIAIFVLLLPLPLLARAKPAPEFIFYLMVAFPFFGFLSVLSAIKRRILFAKLGNCPLQFENFGLVGGKLSGRIIVNQRLPNNSTFNLKLTNKSLTTTPKGSRSANQIQILWQRESQVFAEFDSVRSVIPVNIDIPFDTSPSFSDEPGQNNVAGQFQALQTILAKLQPNRFFWDLTVENSDANFKLIYEVPILKTANSDSKKTKSLEVAVDEPASLEDQPKSYIITETPNGTEIVFLKNKVYGFAAVFSLFGFVFLGIGLGIGKFAMNLNFKLLAALTAIIPISFSLFGLLFIVLAAVQVLQKVKITISQSELIIQKKILFFSTTKTISYGDVRSLSYGMGMRQGDEVWYDIKLDCGKKLPLTIPTAIKNKNELLVLMQRLEQQGLKRAA